MLIVVVGAYLSFDNLAHAGRFTEEVTAFWREPRQFSRPHGLSTITALASDVAGAVSVVDDQGHSRRIDDPTFDNCKVALLDWAARIKTDDGVGVLHWVGHGRERALNGGMVSLYVHGGRDEAPGSQQGVDWTRALYRINQMTDGLPVYCFIDACRQDAGDPVCFEGIGSCDSRYSDNAMVFQATRPGMKAFWIDAPKPALQNAGCRGEAVATRAFLAALDGFGAQYAGDRASEHPILAPEIVQGSSALLDRWLVHQGLPPGNSTTGPRRWDRDPILVTDKPQSVVDVARIVPIGASNCAAAAGSGTMIPAETPKAPFEFRLRRMDHDFIFDQRLSSGPQAILNPRVPL